VSAHDSPLENARSVIELEEKARQAAAVLPAFLERVSTELRRYVVVSREQATALALWVFHTHAIDAADATPYLSIFSAQRESGKTRLLEVLELLIARSLVVANISDAALFRVIAEVQPTLLFDEVDSIFGPKSRDREDLRGMLNAGYRRGARVYRVGGKKMNELQTFPVFAAKALAGIGTLPDTIASRTIPIRLKRRTQSETIDRFHPREAGPALELLRLDLEQTAERLIDRLTPARPGLPAQLSDRMKDVWEPLFAIAELAGPTWAEQARHAAVKLATNREVEDDAIAVQLLADIRSVLAVRDRITTRDLIAELAALYESPWATYRRDDKPITAAILGALLRPFEIRSRSIRLPDGTTPKGYLREQFEDAFLRYLPPETPQRHNPHG
jgi:hypothetical protein